MADETETPDSGDSVLEEAREAFKLVHDAENDNRTASLDDTQFARLGGDYQWTVNGKNWAEERRKAGRPVLTINMLPKFMRQVMNDIRQNRPAIKVRPADSGADVKTADVITGVVRNIEQQSHADTAWDTAAEHAVAGGIGYAKINVKYAYDDSFDQDIRVERVPNPRSIYGDPHDLGADSAEWNSAFEVELVPEDEFKRRFPKAKKSNFEDAELRSMTSPWREGDEILIARWWRRKVEQRKILLLSDGRVVAEEDWTKVFDKDTGATQEKIDTASGITVAKSRMAPTHRVTHTLLSGCEVIEPETKWPGRYIPIIPVYGEDVIVDGKRILKSLIRDARDPQTQLNFWRTYMAEMIALQPKTPWTGPVGSFETDPNWNVANQDNLPFLEYDIVQGGTRPERVAPPPIPVGAFNQANVSNDDIKGTLGLFDASVGAKSNETSGKAIMARQREGDVSTFHFADNLNRAIRHAGVIILDLIPKVYSQKRMIRILGEDGKPQTVQVGPPAPAPIAQAAE